MSEETVEVRKDLIHLFNFIIDFDNVKEERAIDLCHNIFLLGAVLSKKPDKILEIGIGTGYTLNTAMAGVKYNKKGSITCIDNFYDWNGKIQEDIINTLAREGIEFIVSSEEDFMKSCPSNSFDFIMSDGDHRNCGLWIDEYLRVGTPDAFIFIHDTKSGGENMKLIHSKLSDLSLPHYTFFTSSREDERCEDGFTFIINKKFGGFS